MVVGRSCHLRGRIHGAPYGVNACLSPSWNESLMSTRKTAIYYGWVVVAIGFITMMLIMGIFFSSGVLFAAIIAEFGWSRATASLPFSLALITYAGTAWLAGRLFDRYGPRRLFPLGA